MLPRCGCSLKQIGTGRPLVRAADTVSKSPTWLICGYCRRSRIKRFAVVQAMPRSLRAGSQAPCLSVCCRLTTTTKSGTAPDTCRPGPRLGFRSGRVGSWLYGIGLGTRVRDCGARDRLFETPSHVSAGLEILHWSEISRRVDFGKKSRIRTGGHGPAQLARRVLVAPGGCRRAPARSATCPASTLPGRTCSHTVAASQSAWRLRPLPQKTPPTSLTRNASADHG